MWWDIVGTSMNNLENAIQSDPKRYEQFVKKNLIRVALRVNTLGMCYFTPAFPISLHQC